MTPFVPVVHGAQAEIGFSLGGVTVENRLWFLFDTPPIDVPALQGLTDGLALWHTTRILPYLSQDIELLSVLAHKWDDHDGDIGAQTFVNLNGGDSSKTYSANVMVRVNLRWPLGIRGRMNANYVPGIPDSAIIGNQVNPTFASNLFEAYAALIDAARLFTPILTWRWVVASSYDGGVLRSEQLVGECIGPTQPESYRVGQSRRRLE